MKRLKKLTLVLLAVLVLAASLPMGGVAADSVPSAPGSNADWSPVSSAEEFLAMENGKAYYLTGDIDFGGRTVQYLVELFTGMLDGRGYTLKNFALATADDVKSGHMGVFAKVCESNYTVIRNLNIGTAQTPIEMTNTYSGDSYTGFLAGQLMTDGNVGVFENIAVYGNYTNRSEGKYFSGGIFGYAKKFVMTNCSFCGSLIDEVNNGAEKNLGGLIGLVNAQMNRQNVMTGCTNNADISATGSGNVRAGGMIAFSGSPVKMEDCNNTGDIASTQYSGGMVGNQYASDLFLRNCSSTGSVSGSQAGDLRGGSENVGVRYFYAVNCSAQNTEVTEVSTLEDLQRMTAQGGVYRLVNDLDLEGQSFENFVFSGADGFNGVFDGNGHAIYNFTVNGGASNDAGFFNFLSKSSDTLITNLRLGTQAHPVAFSTAANTGTAKTVGVLAAHMNNNTTHSTLIDNVDICANLRHTGGKVNIGGFFGTSRRSAFLDCSFSGSMSGNLTALGSNWLNLAAFVADVEADQTIFYNCTNYADISVATSAGSDVRCAGFAGYATKNNEFVNCANFGNINVTGGSAPVAAGFQGNNAGTSKNLVYGCTNFGSISSTQKASAFFSNAVNPAVMIDAVNFGTVTAPIASDAFYNDSKPTDGYAAVKLLCASGENDLNFSMLTGASVRLNAPAGLRFAAKLNTTGSYYARLLRYADVEYGMLIAPTVFVQNAGAFTREALDVYGSGVLGYTDGKQAYVTVNSTGAWFEDTEGCIAGSLVSIKSEHYTHSFSGVAYLNLTVNGEVLRTVYAADAQARTVKNVATAALEDLLYADADGKLHRADGSEYTGSDAKDYTNIVRSDVTLNDVVGTFTEVSPYTSAQREVLQSFAN